MAKIIGTLFVLSLIGCAGSSGSDKNQHTYYRQVSSTCGAPYTDFDISSIEPFLGDGVFYFNMNQVSGSGVCKFTAGGSFETEGNEFTTSFREVSGSEDCGTALIWHGVYAFTHAGDTLTLTTNTCTNVFEKQ